MYPNRGEPGAASAHTMTAVAPKLRELTVFVVRIRAYRSLDSQSRIVLG